ncbi:hypothetical protein [Streptomyces sirii]
MVGDVIDVVRKAFGGSFDEGTLNFKWLGVDRRDHARRCWGEQ